MEAAAAALDATRALVLGAFAARGGGHDDGANSTVSWLRGHLWVPAARRVRVARALPMLPLVAAAMGRGEISHAHTEVITGLARGGSEAPPRALTPFEDQLVAAAGATDPTTLFALTPHLREQLNDRPRRRERRRRRRRDPAPDQVERNRFTAVTGWRGRVHLDGDLDPVGGAELLAALRGRTGAVRREPAPGRDDRDPAPRRRAALADPPRRRWVRRCRWVGGEQRARGRRPHLVLTADLATVLGHAGAPAARTAGGAALATEALARLVCNPFVTGSTT
jgi:hypothetical protein